MNEMKKPLDSGFFQFVDQRGFVSGDFMEKGVGLFRHLWRTRGRAHWI